MKNFISRSRALLAGLETPEEAKQYFSNKWYSEFVDLHNNYTLEQLLNPQIHKLTVNVYPNVGQRQTRKIFLAGFNGVWRVLLLERSDKSLELDVGVLAGSCYRFHSEVIRQSIIRRFGTNAYNEWRELVKSDIESLKDLIQIVQTKINCVPWSYTCSKSSARLCEQAGISTHRGVAFLFPDTYR